MKCRNKRKWDLLPGDFGHIPRPNRATNHPAVAGRHAAERPHDPEDPIRGAGLALGRGAPRNVRGGIHDERRPRGLAENVAT